MIDNDDVDINKTVEKEQPSPDSAEVPPAKGPWRINLELEKVQDSQEIDYLKPFMLRFDALKVGSPYVLMDRVSGKDPEWSVVAMSQQLIDPEWETRAQRFIALWHNKANAAWFPERGFLKEDFNNPGNFKWTWNANHDPFKKPKSKIYNL